MAYANSYWVNFRSSLSPAGFGGDNATYDVTNLSPGEAYPVVAKPLAGIYSQGWTGTPGAVSDENLYNVRHSAGRHNVTTGSEFFRIGGLTIGHTYRLRGLFGRIASTSGVGISIAKDASFTLINSGVNADIQVASLASGSVCDIRGNVYTTYALWEAAQDTSTCYTDYTCSGTTDLYFGRSNSNFQGPNMGAIGIEDLSAPAVTAFGATFMMMGVG